MRTPHAQRLAYIDDLTNSFLFEEQSDLYATFGLVVSFAANTAIATAALLMRTLFRHFMYDALGQSNETDDVSFSQKLMGD